MKLLLYTDNHFCKYSSILRSRGTRYSTRIENQLNSLIWVGSMAVKYGVKAMICLGDFFDKPQLEPEEITALAELHFPDGIDKIFLVGNHESNMADLSFNSSNVFKGNAVWYKPRTIDFDDIELCFLPYCNEESRQTIEETFGKKTKKRIIFSHNDLKIQYGPYISKVGYEVKDIEDNCDLFFNGHLHNATNVGEKIVLVGNLTGQNFSEDAFRYPHRIIILDTDTMTYESVENPYAFNFYQVTENTDLTTLKNNAIVSAVVSSGHAVEMREKLEGMNNVITFRVVETKEVSSITEFDTDSVDLSIDYLQKFSEYIKSTMGESASINSEIEHICTDN